MRTALLLAVTALGCSTSTSSNPGGDVDAGTSPEGGTPENPCFGDGWCVETPEGLPGLLVDVWASGPDDAWALAQDTSLFRWNGKVWSKTKLEGSQADAIFGRSRDDVWVSIDGRILHWNGSTWTPETVTPATSLLRFAIDAAGVVWARSGGGGLYRREAGAWVAVLRDGSDRFSGASIAACGDRLWFAAGLMGEWDGKALWLHGTTEGDDRVLGAGSYGTGKGWVSSRWLRRYVDGTFKANLLEAAPKGLFAMSVASDTEAWALADGPSLWSFDGTKWKSWTTDVKDMISVSYAKPGFVRLMRRNGAIFEVDLATGTQTVLAKVAWLTIASAKAAATWVGSTDAYYSDSGRLLHWHEGSDTWQSAGSSDDATTMVWAPSVDSAWVGGGTSLRHWDGTKANDIKPGTLDADETWLAVGGNGDADVWALSTKRDFHYDGATWKAFPSGFSGASTFARAVGVGDGKAWFFRDRGHFARFDGTNVIAEPLRPTMDWAGCTADGQMLGLSQEPTEVWKGPPLGMTKVAGTYDTYRGLDVWFGSKGQAWILGTTDVGGQVLNYWDGSALRTSVDKPGRSYLALWALESGEAWAVGYGGILHRKPPG